MGPYPFLLTGDSRRDDRSAKQGVLTGILRLAHWFRPQVGNYFVPYPCDGVSVSTEFFRLNDRCRCEEEGSYFFKMKNAERLMRLFGQMFVRKDQFKKHAAQMAEEQEGAKKQ